jgi:putative Mn2+ efflux pump MntP
VRFGELLVLAVGLAMDATAISAAKGIAVPKVKPRHALIVAGVFGGFQALMPLFGWLLGTGIGRWITQWAHPIAFVLLAGVGAKMLWEARHPRDDDPDSRVHFGFRVMILLGIATSIDAFAAGISLSLVKAPLLISIATIGVVTAAMSAAGLYAGRKFGTVLGRRLDVLGGLVLIALGVKILVE